MLDDTIAADHHEKILFSNFHIISPDVIKYTNKFVRKISQHNIEQVFLGRSTGLQDGSGLHLILDRMSRNQSRHSDEILNLLLASFSS